ncbi:MAG TPA: type II toxin-antitoxin system HicA family toxin [Armatimonadota bacterium]
MPPKLPKGLTAQTVIAAFEKAGGIRRPGKGSHVNIKMPNGQLITIPAHGEVKIGLLHAAVVKAGLSAEGFSKLLGRGS